MRGKPSGTLHFCPSAILRRPSSPPAFSHAFASGSVEKPTKCIAEPRGLAASSTASPKRTLDQNSAPTGASASMMRMPSSNSPGRSSSFADAIMPFPGGIARSGSKIGSKYKGVVASTNDPYSPTLRGAVKTALDEDIGSVLEIVIDGLTLVLVEAVRVLWGKLGLTFYPPKILAGAVNLGWTTPWLWAAQPPHDLGGALCAGLVFAAGLVVATVRGASAPREI